LRNKIGEIDKLGRRIMPSRHDELDADFASILAEVGIPITWNGTDYPAIVADPQVQLDLQSGGFLPESDFQVKLRKSALPMPWPKTRQTVVIRGETYAIKGITDRPTSPLLILHVARS
jgi:hypothetical protein